MTGWIGISLGDVTGIGPEVALKAVAAEAPSDDTRYLLIGDEDLVSAARTKSFRLNLPLKPFSGYDETGRFFVTNPLAEPLPEDLPAGFAAGRQRRGGVAARRRRRCLRRRTRRARHRARQQGSHHPRRAQFVGQTEFLSELAGAKRTAMMLLGHG